MLPLGRNLLLSTIPYLFFIPLSQAVGTTARYSLVAPIYKDANTSLHTVTLLMRSPLTRLNLTLDLGGRYVWVVCEQGYKSVFYHPVQCGTRKCKFAGYTGCGDCDEGPIRPGCNNNTCTLTAENPVPPVDTTGQVSEDMLAMVSSNGSVPGFLSHEPRFLFVCAPEFLMWGIPEQSKGMAALGIHRLSLPNQLSRSFSLPRKFAICLPSSTGPDSIGVLFLGDGPYVLQFDKEVSKSLIYTPLVVNPVSHAFNPSKGEPSYEYFVRVTGVKVNDKLVPINTTLLTFDKQGNYGTKISSVTRFMHLERSIFNAVSDAFVKAAQRMGLKRVKTKYPLEVCFSTKSLLSTRAGPAVPTIDLVLRGTERKSKEVVWRIFGANSIVFTEKNRACLAVVDGGTINPELTFIRPRPSIIIGSHQLEDNLLQFDLDKSRMGFSSSLLFQQTTCSNFRWSR